MGVWPDPQLKLEALIAQQAKRELLWFTDFLAWPNVPTQQPNFGIYQSAGTPTQIDNGEGGWASLGQVSATIIGGLNAPIYTSYMKPNMNIAARFKGTFAVPAAAVAFQGMCFATTFGTNDAVISVFNGNQNSVGLVQGTTGNLLFKSLSPAAVLQSTDLGVPPVTSDEWEIRTLDAGVSWQALKNGVVVANHATSVPDPTAAGHINIGLARSSGAAVMLVDWTMGECDRVG